MPPSSTESEKRQIWHDADASVGRLQVTNHASDEVVIKDVEVEAAPVRERHLAGLVDRPTDRQQVTTHKSADVVVDLLKHFEEDKESWL